jgi:hypothetical protein
MTSMTNAPLPAPACETAVPQRNPIGYTATLFGLEFETIDAVLLNDGVGATIPPTRNVVIWIA